MADTAHFRASRSGSGPAITVQDDRGHPIRVLDLPDSMTETSQADDELRAAGYTRSADWTETADGWTAPVVAEGSA